MILIAAREKQSAWCRQGQDVWRHSHPVFPFNFPSEDSAWSQISTPLCLTFEHCLLLAWFRIWNGLCFQCAWKHHLKEMVTGLRDPAATKPCPVPPLLFANLPTRALHSQPVILKSDRRHWSLLGVSRAPGAFLGLGQLWGWRLVCFSTWNTSRGSPRAHPI